jgi:hypothetical protein
MKLRSITVAAQGATLALLFAIATLSAPTPAHAAPDGPRVVSFDVFLGDRAIGYQRFLLSGRGGEMRVESRAEFAVKLLGITAYGYDHRNVEVWRDGCLRSIESTTDANGERYRVQGRSSGDAFVVAAASGERQLPKCVGTFAYWDRAQLSNRTRLLNPQTGEYVTVALSPLGEGTVVVAGRPVPVERYALRGPDLDITLAYASGSGEWLALESRLDGGRLLRYVRSVAPRSAAG